MFGMYTEKARRALELAAEEARDPGGQEPGGWVLPEHLVLALLRMSEDENAVGPQVLSRLGVTREAFLSLLQGWGYPSGGFRAGKRRRPRINPETHLVLERSLQLALDLDRGHVATEHLLLGILYETRVLAGGPAGRALVELGATYEAVRELAEGIAAREETLDEGLEPALPFAAVPVVRKTQSATRIFEYARQQAQQDRSYKGRVGTHHYLLACMMDMEGDMLAARVLESFGLSYAAIKARAEELYDSVDASDAPGPTSSPPTPYPEVIEEPSEGAIPEEELEELRRINRLLEEREEDL